jgi:heme/copper-type cytochrome/quinol oxidase subunit 2
MDIVVILMYVVLFLIALFLSFASVKYFITMWKFKNRKKDGSEDDDFKRFD